METLREGTHYQYRCLVGMESKTDQLLCRTVGFIGTLHLGSGTRDT